MKDKQQTVKFASQKMADGHLIPNAKQKKELVVMELKLKNVTIQAHLVEANAKELNPAS